MHTVSRANGVAETTQAERLREERRAWESTGANGCRKEDEPAITTEAQEAGYDSVELQESQESVSRGENGLQCQLLLRKLTTK